MPKKGLNLFSFLLFITIFTWPLVGQSTVKSDFQSWYTIIATGNFHFKNRFFSHLKYWLEPQERVGDKSRRFTQTLLRPGLGIDLTPNLSFWAGYAWVRTAQPLTDSPFEEDRIWEQLLWTKTIRNLTFTSRTRMEQRILENRPKVAYRIRQLVKISIPFEAFPKLSLVSSEEFFWHKNNFIGRNGRGFDQNRYFLGFGYKWSSKATSEIGFLNQYIRRFGIPNFSANAVMVNLFLNFD